MKKFLLVLPAVVFAIHTNGQFSRTGGGLTFSSGVDFNTIETGNPGIFGKAYIKIFEKGHFLPSLSIYNPYVRKTTTQSFKNYMFHGDLDIHYDFYREGPLRLYGLIGANGTAIISKYEVLAGTTSHADKSGIKPGMNLGTGVEMYIDNNLDSVLSVKYIAGPWDQFVIQLAVFYHFNDRRRIGW